MGRNKFNVCKMNLGMKNRVVLIFHIGLQSFYFLFGIHSVMLQDSFTNDQYHEFVDPKTLKYEVRSENSIFFEVS